MFLTNDALSNNYFFSPTLNNRSLLHSKFATDQIVVCKVELQLSFEFIVTEFRVIIDRTRFW